VIEVVSDARSTSQQLATTMSVSLAAPSRALNAPRVNWRRTTLRFSYWLAKNQNNTDGAFSVPASGTLDTEWAPAPGDRRHRVSGAITTTALKNLNANVSFNANSGTPFTITTGADNNSDSIFNDRPVGGVRNGVRTPWQYTWNGNVSYSIPFGPPAAAATPAAARRPAAAAPPGRYRLGFNVTVTNLNNRANYVGFSGVQTSRFFLQPTAVSNPRKVDVGMSLRFRRVGGVRVDGSRVTRFPERRAPDECGGHRPTGSMPDPRRDHRVRRWPPLDTGGPDSTP
jgi:hypothetical protein